MNNTKNDSVYFRNNIQVEPLINGWYAWYNIIPPVSTAVNIVERSIPIMESYIKDPKIHSAFVKNPAMRGGPFIDLDGDQSIEVSEMLEKLKVLAAPIFPFVNNIRELDHLLKEKALGFKLEELYEEIPQGLKGYVELYYDRHHRPDFRFFEALIYKSPFYIESFQSITFSFIESDANRPFILSTPRLLDENKLNLPLPFKSQELDELFTMKRTPNSFVNIAKKLQVPADQLDLFSTFFTEEAPKKYEKYTGTKIRTRYFGHACVLIETKDTSILLDPVLSYTYESDISRYTYDDLPDEIDYILITHGHHDHILLESLLQLRHKVKTIVVGKNINGALQDPSIKLLFTNLGFKNVIELNEFEQITNNGLTITGIPFIGEHHDIHIASKLCYHIKSGDYSILSVADSCNQSPELYKHVHDFIGDVDILFLGMECDGAPSTWVYGPFFTEKQEREKDHSRRSRGSNCREGMDLVHRFNCKEVYVYAMGAEPWIDYILEVHYTDESNPIIQSNMLVEKCRSEGRRAERLFGEAELFSQTTSLTPKKRFQI
jgi:L-ascorbate metabolism protein UlaG (beta-lactamase superfamily)